MTVTLLPPLTRSGAWAGRTHGEALREGPGYARTRNMSRWHRVRSAVQHTLDGEARHVSYQAWCGQQLYSGSCRAVDVPDDGAPVCGTCEGRAEGHNPQRPDLLFTPWDLTPPAWCPSRLIYTQEGPNVGRCCLCGELAPIRAYGWNGRAKIQRHLAKDLVAGCPFHAWREMTAVDGVAVCRCQVPPWTGGTL